MRCLGGRPQQHLSWVGKVQQTSGSVLEARNTADTYSMNEEVNKYINKASENKRGLLLTKSASYQLKKKSPLSFQALTQ